MACSLGFVASHGLQCLALVQLLSTAKLAVYGSQYAAEELPFRKAEVLSVAANAVGCGAEELDVAGCVSQKLFPRGAGLARKTTNRGNAALTYGEVPTATLDDLLSAPNLVGVPPGNGDGFADFGSGIGRLPLHVFLRGVFARAVGVECDVDRARLAVLVLEQLAVILAEKTAAAPAPAGANATALLETGGRRLELVHDDVLEQPLAGLTIIFLSTPWLPHLQLTKLMDRFARELMPGALVWSLVELPLGTSSSGVGRCGLVLANQIQVDAGWSGFASAWLYLRILPTPPQTMPLPTPLLPSAMAKHRLWANEFENAARSEYGELKAVAESLKVADPEQHGLSEEQFIVTLAHMYGSAANATARRLLQMLASVQNIKEDGARRKWDCCCGLKVAVDAPYFLDDIGFLDMVSHGFFLPAEVCPGGIACTAGDLLVSERVAREHRYLHAGLLDQGKVLQGLHADGLGRDVNITTGSMNLLEALRGFACLRLSDPQSLLHSALGYSPL